ncbi:MAG: hypothetical protein IPG44_06480 [Anaerolineales bacterium]|nr:hypothetical protein [Anaerolineales bacterium]
MKSNDAGLAGFFAAFEQLGNEPDLGFDVCHDADLVAEVWFGGEFLQVRGLGHEYRVAKFAQGRPQDWQGRQQ